MDTNENILTKDKLYVRNHSTDVHTSEELQSEKAPVDVDLDVILNSLNDNITKFKQDISLVVEKKNVSYGTWRSEKKLVEIVNNKGHKQYMPHFIDQRPYLNPFEALFAVECRTLVITNNNIALSIEECYKLLLQNRRDTELYRIFSILSKSGYFVKYLSSVKGKSEGENNETNKEKRLIENVYLTTKRHKKESEDQQEKTNFNHKVVTSIRPLNLEHFKKLSKTDRKLLSSQKLPQNPITKSILYCVKESAVPVVMNKKLLPIHGFDRKPLVGLSSILETSQLFSLIQQAGPKCKYNHFDEQMLENLQLSINFQVFSTRTNASSNKTPLFCVLVVNLNDPLPSFSQIKHFQANRPDHLFFALVSDSLEFNFYRFKNLAISEEYPKFWEDYYA